jgi:hypothetical protein
MRCLKAFAERIAARDPDRQTAEIHIRVALITCSIPDDHIDPRRSAFFMARSVLRDIRSEVRGC